MKIAMIGLRGIPAKSGGVEVVVDHLAPLLAKKGVDVTVYCRSSYCDTKLKSYKGVKLKYLPTINTKYTEAIVHTLLASIHAMFSNYDIVHYHAMGNGLFSILPRLTGKKTIVTLHGIDWQREKWGFFAKLYLKLCERLILIFPDRVISVSEKVQKYYKEKYSKDIEYIPNGVDIIKPLPLKALKRYGLGRKKYILFLSRIVPEKGVHTLIQAFKQVKTPMKLVIAGDATHTEGYLNEVKGMAKGDKRIIFTGPLYGEAKIEAFSNAFLFVLPSTIEGMPIVLLEAMSFGLPCLVSDIEENKTVIDKNGILFGNKNTEDLKTKLTKVITLNINKTELVKYVKNNYLWDKIVLLYLSQYRWLMQI